MGVKIFSFVSVKVLSGNSKFSQVFDVFYNNLKWQFTDFSWEEQCLIWGRDLHPHFWLQLWRSLLSGNVCLSIPISVSLFLWQNSSILTLEVYSLCLKDVSEISSPPHSLIQLSLVRLYTTNKFEFVFFWQA